MSLRPNFKQFHLSDILKVNYSSPDSMKIYMSSNHYTASEWNVALRNAQLTQIVCTAYDKKHPDKFALVEQTNDKDARVTYIDKTPFITTGQGNGKGILSRLQWKK